MRHTNTATFPVLADDELHVWLLPYQRAQGRGPLLATLARYLGLPVDAVGLQIEPHGRPSLDDKHGLSFNWSHSEDRAAIALARGVTPGIDIERLRPRPQALEIARRFFTPEEADALGALDATQCDEAFLRLWTAKEAVLKATGRGLAFGLHRLHIEQVRNIPLLRRIEGQRADDWQLHALDAGPTHLAALAWRGAARRIVSFRDDA